MNGKKGILTVSFGTSHIDTLHVTIEAVERQIAEHFPEYRVYRAFTSGMIIQKLKKEENLQVFTVREALEKMVSDGVSQVIVQPTHIINGIENDRMMEDILEYAGHFKKIKVGKPLLSSAEDYKKAIHAVMAETELEEGEALLLMDTEQTTMQTQHTLCWSIRFICWDTVRSWSAQLRDFLI